MESLPLKPGGDVEHAPHEPGRDPGQEERADGAQGEREDERGPYQGRELLPRAGRYSLRHQLGQGTPEAEIEEAEVADHDPGHHQDAEALRSQPVNHQREGQEGGGHGEDQAHQVQQGVAGEDAPSR